MNRRFQSAWIAVSPRNRHLYVRIYIYVCVYDSSLYIRRFRVSLYEGSTYKSPRCVHTSRIAFKPPTLSCMYYTRIVWYILLRHSHAKSPNAARTILQISFAHTVWFPSAIKAIKIPNKKYFSIAFCWNLRKLIYFFVLFLLLYIGLLDLSWKKNRRVY